MLKKCSDCGGGLEEGAMMDFTYGGVAVQRHAKAIVPQGAQSIWGTGEANFEDIRRVIAYRCVDCNRLYTYAQEYVLGKTVWQSQKKGMMLGILLGIALVIFAFIFSFAVGGFS